MFVPSICTYTHMCAHMKEKHWKYYMTVYTVDTKNITYIAIGSDTH